MGTVGPSLVHSCTSELTRQGIWLPYSQSMGDHSSVQRVRVTPGVNRPLAQLNPGFRYLHWPGFISRTHPFGLAAYCVSYLSRYSPSEARADLTPAVLPLARRSSFSKRPSYDRLVPVN